MVMNDIEMQLAATDTEAETDQTPLVKVESCTAPKLFTFRRFVP